MFNFSKADKSTVYGALLDISSGSVGISIVMSQRDSQLPEILYARRIEMRITKQSVSEESSLRKIREALFSACLTLSQEGLQALRKKDAHGKISKVFVTCSSPWAYTIARNVRYENDEEFKVSETLINDLAHSAEEEIIILLRARPELKKRDFSIIERATVDVTINDYPVINPFNLKGTSLTLSHIAGLIPKEIIGAIQEVQDKLFPGTELRAHTYMLVMYCVMRDIFPKQHSVCIIDVTNEATEFGIVENNLLIENTFIPYGTSTFLRDISQASGSPVSDIRSSIASYSADNTFSTDGLNEQVALYEQKIADEVESIINHRPFPTEIVITSQKPFDLIFKEMIERAIKRKSINKVTITTLDAKMINGITSGVTDDIYLGIGARFFHKLHGCGEIESH